MNEAEINIAKQEPSTMICEKCDRPSRWLGTFHRQAYYFGIANEQSVQRLDGSAAKEAVLNSDYIVISIAMECPSCHAEFRKNAIVFETKKEDKSVVERVSESAARDGILCKKYDPTSPSGRDHKRLFDRLLYNPDKCKIVDPWESELPHEGCSCPMCQSGQPPVFDESVDTPEVFKTEDAFKPQPAGMQLIGHDSSPDNQTKGTFLVQMPEQMAPAGDPVMIRDGRDTYYGVKIIGPIRSGTVGIHIPKNNTIEVRDVSTQKVTESPVRYEKIGFTVLEKMATMMVKVAIESGVDQNSKECKQSILMQAATGGGIGRYSWDSGAKIVEKSMSSGFRKHEFEEMFSVLSDFQTASNYGVKIDSARFTAKGDGGIVEDCIIIRAGRGGDLSQKLRQFFDVRT